MGLSGARGTRCGVERVTTPQRKLKVFTHKIQKAAHPHRQGLLEATSWLNQSRSSLTTALCSPSLATSTNQ
jgi:hypothetical protein